MKQKQTIDFRPILIGVMIIAAIAIFGKGQAQDKQHCKATTKANKPCKGSAGKDNFCYFHSPARIKCGAKTSAGGECKQIVSKAGDHCRFHNPKTK